MLYFFFHGALNLVENMVVSPRALYLMYRGCHIYNVYTNILLTLRASFPCLRRIYTRPRQTFFVASE